MIELWLFGTRLFVLYSAGAVVLLLLALSSVTYLAMTLTPALGASPRLAGRARGAGVALALMTFTSCAFGLRVGAPGTGGEVVPTATVSVAAASAVGASGSLALLVLGSGVAQLGRGREERRAALKKARVAARKQLAASRRAFLEGDDIRAEVAGAQAALERVRDAVAKLERTRDTVVEKLGALDELAREGELGVDLRHTREEVAGKLELGRRLEEAAASAVHRLACGAPLRLLLRRRPRELAPGPDGDVRASLPGATAAIDRFLADLDGAREALAELEPAGGAPGGEAWARSMRDLVAMDDAFRAVRDRLGVLAVRLDARADIEALASAAGEVSDKARSAGVPDADLKDLVDDVARAEAAVSAASSATDLDARSLAATLARSAAAIGGDDEEASLDDLLKALREVA